MNKTAKGNAYENKVLQLVTRLVNDGTLAIGRHHRVCQKQTYPIDFGTDRFEADISIETTNPHCNNEISDLIIFECKDLATRLNKSDIEEWRGRLKNLPYGAKLYFVTSTGYSKPIIRKARQSGIGLIVWNGRDPEKWIATHTIAPSHRRRLNHRLLQGQQRAPRSPLVYTEGRFLTLPEMLTLHGIPMRRHALTLPSLDPRTIRAIVGSILERPGMQTSPHLSSEQKLMHHLRISLEYRPLPPAYRGAYDATRHRILIHRRLRRHPRLWRRTIAHELGHACLHRRCLWQYEKRARAHGSMCTPSRTALRRLDAQADRFALPLLRQ